MWIAHRHHAAQHGMFRRTHDVCPFLFGGAKRHSLRVKIRFAHIHAHQIVVGDAEHHASGLGADADVAFVGQPFQPHKAGETAGAVTALRHFTAVGVENAIVEIKFRIVRRFYHQHLVKANAQVPIGQSADQFR
ncbi:hypothetical protein D3C79_385510 [compost metagenome]